MANFSETLENKLLPIAQRVGSNRVLLSIRDGITLAMPLIIIGSFVMVLGNLPFDAYTAWLAEVGIAQYIDKIVGGSFGIMGLIASFGVAYSYVNQNKIKPVAAGVLSLSSFLIVSPLLVTEDAKGIPTGILGAKGLFVAILIGLVTGAIYVFCIKKKLRIVMPDGVPPAVADSFTALIPGSIVLVLSGVVFALVENLGFDSIHDIVNVVLGAPLAVLGATLPGTVAVVMLNSFFWFFGIHGGSVVNSLIQPIWLANAEQNVALIQAGQAPTNIFTLPFIDNFVFMGGGGATLGLVIVIALIAFHKSSSQITKGMAPLTLVPGMFNINEPAMFGLPIVLNVSLLIPFLLAPVVNVLISYAAMATGIVPLTTGVIVSWTMPPIISGFLTTNSIMGSVLQLVCIVVDCLIYLPFYLTVEKQNLLEEQED